MTSRLQSLWVSNEPRLSRFVSEQPPYHILNRRIERELVPVALTDGVGIIPRSPLASGKLTGIYRIGQDAPEGSGSNPAEFSDEDWTALSGIESITKDKGCTMTALSLAWLNCMPGVTYSIIGPKSVDQLKENLAASELAIVDEIVKPGTRVEDYYKADFGPNARW